MADASRPDAGPGSHSVQSNQQSPSDTNAHSLNYPQTHSPSYAPYPAGGPVDHHNRYPEHHSSAGPSYHPQERYRPGTESQAYSPAEQTPSMAMISDATGENEDGTENHGKRKNGSSSDDAAGGPDDRLGGDADAGNADMSRSQDGEPKKKRRRQALSCTECKRRKIKCDRNHPCTPCSRRNEQDKCRWLGPDGSFDDMEPLGPPNPASPVQVLAPRYVPPPPTASLDKYVLRTEYDDLKAHVFRLEHVLASMAPPGALAHLHPAHPQHQLMQYPTMTVTYTTNGKPDGSGGPPQSMPSHLLPPPPPHMFMPMSGYHGTPVGMPMMGLPPPPSGHHNGNPYLPPPHGYQTYAPAPPPPPPTTAKKVRKKQSQQNGTGSLPTPISPAQSSRAPQPQPPPHSMPQRTSSAPAPIPSQAQEKDKAEPSSHHGKQRDSGPSANSNSPPDYHAPPNATGDMHKNALPQALPPRPRVGSSVNNIPQPPHIATVNDDEVEEEEEEEEGDDVRDGDGEGFIEDEPPMGSLIRSHPEGIAS